MTRGLFGLLMLLAVATAVAGAEVDQTTTGWCSPAQDGNNNVVICNGVDPRAMARLQELLDLKDLSLKQKIAEANEWAQKYHDINAELEDVKRRLTATGEDATLVQAAQDLLHEGKLDERAGSSIACCSPMKRMWIARLRITSAGRASLPCSSG